MEDQIPKPDGQDPEKNDGNKFMVAVTMVYTVPEKSSEAFLGLIRQNMAPWLTGNIVHQKAQTHQTSLAMIVGMSPDGAPIEVEIPITQIVEVGNLE